MIAPKVFALGSLVAGAIAGPVTAPSPVSEAEFNDIVKRAEGIHLVNCKDGATNIYSVVVYCANDSNCNFRPSSSNACYPTSGVMAWEGGGQSCGFSTGVYFSWNIQSDAQTKANYSKVGTGGNGFRDYTIYKDDQHHMYTDSDGHSCKSIYYAV
ncbi:predicted protein [Chaetomium globosum CBS 148.51]|uniref:Small secreted protein n=1 Tax=Chaetomium globosum (strain ATCC 6205 / CBS 148.51 / DSM 1962 / NBRC 6347 / NRRL 1970) TaxID=306901 RepID=Q2H3S8_CHAGB|nr:uncharacterized protein CHGG_06687 [Chaetomium globosum CBS 148.51]EAQ90068.1 predicted protein [Chaetomium globosum CBS 148.51]